MTVSGTVKSCVLKEHRKSARLELNERTVAYTLFDIKHVPALSPGTLISFETVERQYKEATYWAVVDGSLSFPRGAPPQQTSIDSGPPPSSYDEYRAFDAVGHVFNELELGAEESARPANNPEPQKKPPPVTGDDKLARIATALERIADILAERNVY